VGVGGSYRDLARPIGALNADRLAMFRQRHACAAHAAHTTARSHTHARTHAYARAHARARTNARTHAQRAFRYADMPEPKFLYGTHYSAPG
jgi:hypothetical protein